MDKGIFIAILDLECSVCMNTPVVGIEDPNGVRCTGLCGVHFFSDRNMDDPELWNEPAEATE